MVMSQMPDEAQSGLKIVNEHLEFPPVSLEEPTDSSYVPIAAEVDTPFLPYVRAYPFDSEEKRALISTCKSFCEQLVDEGNALDATVFKAIMVPPGRGEYLNQTDRDVHVAGFDIVVLIELADEHTFQRLKSNETYLELRSRIEEASRYTHAISATNIRKAGLVDHDSDGVFLFNYFFADDTEQNLEVWEYTAGWFEAETGLDNSMLFLPDDPSKSEYALLNHCRWDRLLDILPSLLFKRTFREYVLKNFEANRVAAMPILYKLA
jgi:hypothetical protein